MSKKNNIWNKFKQGVSKITLSNQRVLSFFALFISLFTLIVFIYQTRLIQKQQYMSAYPHLTLTNYNSGSIDYKYILKNDGVGPALIEKIYIKDSLKSKSYNSLVEYLYENLDRKDSISTYNSDLYKGQLISAGEEITLFGLLSDERLKETNYPKNTILGAKKIRAVLNNKKLKIKIYYKSIYEESWSISNHSSIPIKE